MNTNRSWMYARINEDGSMSQEFARGVKEFVDFCFGPNGNSREGLILCPCARCSNSYHCKKPEVYMHLLQKGFTSNYFFWCYHGESNRNYDNRYNDYAESSSAGVDVDVDADVDEVVAENPYVDLVTDLFPDINLVGNNNNLGEQPNPKAKLFYEMFAKAQISLWDENPTTLLEFCADVAGSKSANRGTQASTDDMVRGMLKCVHPKIKDTLPQNWQQVKKFMLHLGLSHRTYDFCINHCFLYYKDGLHLDSCPTCGESRYEPRIGKGKRVAQRKLWFFPLTERLQRLYMCRKTAEHMIYHSTVRRRSDPVIHPAGSEQWARMDDKFPDFANEIRNVRLGLCTAGFDPHHGTTTNPHSIWPVFITPYNLPPDLCMRPEFIFMTLLIQGPEDPTKDIDVMLRHVVDELKDLWIHGAVTYDSFKRENFLMKAYLFGTINDFPGYGMLSGWSTSGKLGCPCCMQNTEAFRLNHSKKMSWFDNHRKFLPPNHPEHRNRVDYIAGRVVPEVYQERMDINSIYRQVMALPDVQFGKCTKNNPNKYKPPAGKSKVHNWTKRSIFWEMEYWPYLYVRHNLDVMHNEKNCFEMVHTTMFQLGKLSRDTVASRKDLEELTTRSELFITPNGEKKKATYTLGQENTQAVCEWLKTLRFPDGHCSNLAAKVKADPWRITKMKSHDCHVFMQRLLPCALKDLVPEKVWEALCELSNFFRAICAPEISPEAMARLGPSIVQTLCKLEKIFPPSFFNSMEHIIVHLPYEAMMLGPVFYRWMYPFERMMWLLKHNSMNQNHIEGSVAQAYLMREVSNFTKMYSTGEITRTRRNDIGNFTPQFDGQLQAFVPVGIPCGRGGDKILSETDFNRIILYAVRNSPEFDAYVGIFDAQYVGMSPKDLEITRVKYLVDWLRAAHTGRHLPFTSHMLALLRGGSHRAVTYNIYMCNGYRWHTYEYGEGRKSMCSGVSILASGIVYYGMLQEIVEVTFYAPGYAEQKICLFKCDWYNPRHVQSHPKYGYVEVNSRKIWNTQEKFIFAAQAQQVYYTPYAVSSLPGRKARRKGMWVACPARPRHLIDFTSLLEGGEEDNFYEDHNPLIVPDDVDDLTTFVVRGELAEDIIDEDDEEILLSDVEIEDEEEEAD